MKQEVWVKRLTEKEDKRGKKISSMTEGRERPGNFRDRLDIRGDMQGVETTPRRIRKGRGRQR